MDSTDPPCLLWIDGEVKWAKSETLDMRVIEPVRIFRPYQSHYSLLSVPGDRDCF